MRLPRRYAPRNDRKDRNSKVVLCQDENNLVFCLIPAVFLGLPGHLFAADDSAGIVTKVRGQVTARKTGDEKNAKLREGDAIAVGQILQAAKGSAAQLVLTDDSVIHVLP